MSRYIDADALYKETEKKIKANNEYRMAVVDDEFLDLINDAFTEDVVSKSEVERLEAQNNDLDILVKDLRFRNKELQKANEGLAKNIEELEIENDIVREAYLNFEETSGLKKAKTEVAREIFAEIERIIDEKYNYYVFGNNDLDSIEQDAIINFSDTLSDCFAELKKKYTEEKENDT